MKYSQYNHIGGYEYDKTMMENRINQDKKIIKTKEKTSLKKADKK